MKRTRPAKKGNKQEPAREKRIEMEIIVDAYGALEQAMGGYYYMEDNLKFPFPALCVRKRNISPLKLKENVEAVGMPTESECEREMFVAIVWEGRGSRFRSTNCSAYVATKKPNRPSKTGIIGSGRAISSDDHERLRGGKKAYRNGLRDGRSARGG